jgi:endonuclease YncB( thermonuclease family)
MLSAFPARADDASVAVDKIISGDTVALQDGHILRFGGIKAIAPEAKAFLESTVLHHVLALQEISTDRYGRMTATATVQGEGHSVETALLHQGLAFVYSAAGDDPHLDEWIAAEKEARQNKRGLWRDHTDVFSDDAEKLYGHYGFITGTVTKAERVKNKVYLNFGADWRTDFTITIAAHDLRAFKKQGVDLLGMQGKRLRVRGWVCRDNGPMITVTDPHQIEWMP